MLADGPGVLNLQENRVHPTEKFRFFCPVKISAGLKALEHLPVDLGGPFAGMPLIVADAPWRAKKVAGAFRDSGLCVGVCDTVPSTPDIGTVRQLAGIYRDRRCGALIAVGGGTLVDAAKLVNLMVSLGEDDLGRFCGENTVDSPLRPLAVVLSASGNGLEVSRFASLGDLAFSSPRLMPDLAVIDPRLMRRETPESIVYFCLAALAHAVEAYCGPFKNPVADAHAWVALRLISQNLVAAAGGGGDKRLVLALVNGVASAACAFSNAAPGLLHLLAEAAAAEWELPLGQVLGSLLPFALEYAALNGSHDSAELLLPLAGPEVYSQTAEDLRGAIAVNLVHALLYDLDKATRGAVALTLKEAGVDAKSFATVARRAAAADSVLCAERAAMLVLEHAWSGYPIGAL